MYFAMDDIGDEHIAHVTAHAGEDDTWRYIAQVVSDFGFTGIQLNPKYQTDFGLSLTRIPDSIRESFRLTYHLGGLYHLNTPDDARFAYQKLEESLRIAKNLGIEDVSVHPPVLANASLQPPYLPVDAPERREKSRDQLHSLLKVWIPRFQEQGITLSLESHVTASFFVFSDLPDFRDFVLDLPGLGVLIDVCHNYYDGYDIPELISIVQLLPVTGLHLSDAIRGQPLSQATHLPIGDGTIDFEPLLDHFAEHKNVYAALEVRGPAQGIISSMEQLRSL